MEWLGFCVRFYVNMAGTGLGLMLAVAVGSRDFNAL